jgi:hypothetical protein
MDGPVDPERSLGACVSGVLVSGPVGVAAAPLSDVFIAVSEVVGRDVRRAACVDFVAELEDCCA